MTTPLKVGFDVTPATSRRPRGMASYIFELLPALARVAQDIEPILFLRDDRWFRRDRIAGLLPQAERRWIVEPLKVPLRGLDRFHGMGTRLPASSRVPRSFTLHDMRGFDPLPGAEGPDNESRKARTIGRAERILVLTNHGAERLMAHFGDVDRGNIAVVGHGVNVDRFRPHAPDEQVEVRAKYELPRPFMLQLGSFFPHKNLEASIHGFAQSRARAEGIALVLAGGGGSAEYRANLRDRIRERGIEDQVRWIDNVAAEDLGALVASARLLLMPSRYEGYGLPILEAMAAGTAGITSTATCLPEVSAGIWPAVGPDDVEGWAEAIDRIALNDGILRPMVDRGLSHAATRTWDACARETAAFLRGPVA